MSPYRYWPAGAPCPQQVIVLYELLKFDDEKISTVSCTNGITSTNESNSMTFCKDDNSKVPEFTDDGTKPSENFPNCIDDISFKPMISTTHCMDDSRPDRNVPNYVMKKYCFRKTSRPHRPQPCDPTVHVRWQCNHPCDGPGEVFEWLDGHGKCELVDLVSGVLAGDVHETFIMTITFEKASVAERLCLQPEQYILNQQLQQKFPVLTYRMSAEA